MSVALICRSCLAALPWPDTVAQELRCHGCGAIFPVRFGIPDLRPEESRVAGAAFDRDADLREAQALHEALERTSYRDWFFSGVEARLERIEEPRFRKLMRAYYRDERLTFGQHGGAILQKLDSYLDEHEPVRGTIWRRGAQVALEAGCGTGQYPIGLAQRFREVLVTDLSYVALLQAQKVASENGLAGVRVFASDIESLPLRDGSVDFVHCNGVIEHVADPDRAVRELGRVLSADGIALVLSPNLYSLYTEAHFRVPAFGLLPLPLRRRLAYRLSGARSFAGTTLRSLAELRRYARCSFAHYRIYFIPSRLPPPVRGGLVRRVIHALLSSALMRRPVDMLLNHALLVAMPYHVLVGFKR